MRNGRKIAKETQISHDVKIIFKFLPLLYLSLVHTTSIFSLDKIITKIYKIRIPEFSGGPLRTKRIGHHVTWCIQRRSTLVHLHMDDTGVSYKHLPRGTVMHHVSLPWNLSETPRPRQHIWSCVASCCCGMQSSSTHDTPRSSQMDNHFLRASWALRHETWQNIPRTVHDGRGGFS